MQATHDPMRGPMSAPEEEITTALLNETIEEAKDLLRIEITLARDEALTELRQLRTVGVSLFIFASCVLIAVAALVSAAVVALGYVVGLAAGGALFVVAAIAGFVTYRKLPLHPMAKTRDRLMRDSKTIRERLT